MSTPSRRTRASVIERLLAHPEDFSYEQAIRLLERAAVLENQNPETTSSHGDHPVAKFSPPHKEVIRFGSNSSLAFPGTEIEHLSEDLSADSKQWKMAVNFLGLTGSMGVMPFAYSEMILQRLKLKDVSLKEFLDMFSHRTTSLFFQASLKYRLPLEYERGKLHLQNKTKVCTHTQALLSFLGIGTKGLQDRQTLRDESLIFFSGLFTQQVKNASSLEQMVNYFFGVPVRLSGFIGQWQELIDDVRTKLPSKENRKGQNASLGRTAMLGKKGWFTQGKTRIVVGPLDKEQFKRFAPGTGALKALNEMVSSYVGHTTDFDFVIEVKRDDIPDKIELNSEQPPLLSWNTWLSGRPKTNSDRDDLLDILVTSKKLH